MKNRPAQEIRQLLNSLSEATLIEDSIGHPDWDTWKGEPDREAPSNAWRVLRQIVKWLIHAGAAASAISGPQMIGGALGFIVTLPASWPILGGAVITWTVAVQGASLAIVVRSIAGKLGSWLTTEGPWAWINQKSGGKLD